MRAHDTGKLRLRADYFVRGEKNICFLRGLKVIKRSQPTVAINGKLFTAQ